jgi:hypothetical protein
MISFQNLYYFSFKIGSNIRSESFHVTFLFTLLKKKNVSRVTRRYLNFVTFEI